MTDPLKDGAPYDLKNCARCGNDHDDLVPEKLEKPVDDYTHWCPCPTNGQPILWAQVEEADDDN